MKKFIERFIFRVNNLSKNGKFIVGLTGIIGSGKTTVLNFFSECGAFTISADEISKNLLTEKKYYSIILTRYPKVADDNGKIDRKLLANLIFRDKKAKEFVEGVIHSGVISKIERKLRETSFKIVVIEIPLLFEVALDKAFDLNICVVSDVSNIIKRLRNRGMSYSDIKLRMKSQLSQDFKMMNSDIVIFNNYGLDELRLMVNYLFESFKKLIYNKNSKI